MANTGYSGTTLVNKLGIKPGSRVMLIDPPPDYFQILGFDISSRLCTDGELPDIVHVFARSNNEFIRAMKKLLPVTKQQMKIVVWVSWYKKASKIPTDLTEDMIREYALQNGLVDIKVCAVDAVWSGLKLVVPLADRK